RNRLYVFTTSTSFQPETPYTKFAAYALLNHGGDYQAAARQLAHDGYGTHDHEGDIIIDLPLTPLTPSEEHDNQDDNADTIPDTTTPQHENSEGDEDLPPTWQPANLTPYLDGTYT
ncbi:hypothetical protein, partial [Actinomyces sp. HMSC065F12]|uniref:hypothetical protein n=1 Tax=Actinomyces sp. HMSC065F12 TaxID=1739479 RepID=UPI001D0C5E55